MVLIISIVFVLGYVLIALEHPIKINKAASALVTAAVCWALFALMTDDVHAAAEGLTEHLGEVSGILFFLLGAMTIVELIDAHDGFLIITNRIQTTNKKKLVWIVSLITFFLSAVLDNLTTTIVLISLLRKLIGNKQERLLFAGLVVISANAGGAWSPIGDVTTTMLWIGGQVTALNIIVQTFIPSLICMLLPTFIISYKMKGRLIRPNIKDDAQSIVPKNERDLVFWLGVSCLLFVPVFKTVTHLPPYMGVLFGLGILWMVTELIHSGRDEAEKGLLSVNHALRKIDSPSILFFPRHPVKHRGSSIYWGAE